MKKIYYTVAVLTLLSLVIFSSCKKINEGPFPSPTPANGNYPDLTYITPLFPSIANASGILIAVQAHNEKTVIVTPFQNNYEYGMAQFTGTPGNFNSLINAGSISLNSTSLAQSSTNNYLSSASTFSINLSGSTIWQMGGASNIPAFNYSLNGVYPTFTDSFQKWNNAWIPIYGATTDTQTVRIPISAYANNADSVVVAFINGSYVAQKKQAATDVQAIFHVSDFNGFPGGITNLILQINAIKYRDTVISGKYYYLLKMGSYTKYYTPTK